MRPDGALDPDHDHLTDLIVAVFRLNGRLIETGNRIASEVGITVAWWQVLGALDRSPAPLPVAGIAREMGLARQSVQRTADLLAERGLVRFDPNPRHRRAKLVALTEPGRAAARVAAGRQRPIGRAAEAAIGVERIVDALDVVLRLERLLAEASEAVDCHEQEAQP